MKLIRRLINRLVGSRKTEALIQFRRQWREETRLDKIHHAGLAKLQVFDPSSPINLHVGCGNIYKQGWLNVDCYAIPPCTPDVTLDLRRPWPFPNGSCYQVYSEHVFEHIPFPTGASTFLAESFRVLRPNGKITIGVPDPTIVLRAYLDQSPSPYFDYFNKSPYVERHLKSWPIEAVNWLFRQGGEHQFIYDFPALSELVGKAGFISIEQRDFDPAQDSPSRENQTIYLTAVKPDAS